MATKSAQEYFQALAEELEISEARYAQAYDRYHSLGKWLNRETSSIKIFDPAVYVQGSFALGTVIKPYTDREEYDVDVVCELKKLSKTDCSQKQLKQVLGREIECYRGAHNIQKPVEERRRCWALNYADGAQFHMDIVPALSNGVRVKIQLEQSRLDTRWADSAIGITDNEDKNYSVITEDWPRSNPKGYVQWFKSRMAAMLERKKAELAKSARASVEEIPDYRVRTPLQSAIMILKRHRDTMFATDQTNCCPISIIITTLAGHSYKGEEHVADALMSILSGMDSDKYILQDGTKLIIPNPSDPSENFADKWEEFPARRNAFFKWLNQARQDFKLASELYSRKGISEALSNRIGQDLAKRAEIRSGGTGPAGMLRDATAASASGLSSAPSFGSEPRVPTKPKGFA